MTADTACAWDASREFAGGCDSGESQIPRAERKTSASPPGADVLMVAGCRPESEHRRRRGEDDGAGRGDCASCRLRRVLRGDDDSASSLSSAMSAATTTRSNRAPPRRRARATPTCDQWHAGGDRRPMKRTRNSCRLTPAPGLRSREPVAARRRLPLGAVVLTDWRPPMAPATTSNNDVHAEPTPRSRPRTRAPIEHVAGDDDRPSGDHAHESRCAGVVESPQRRYRRA